MRKIRINRYIIKCITYGLVLISSALSVFNFILFFFYEDLEINYKNKQKNGFCSLIKNISVHGTNVEYEFTTKITPELSILLKERIFYETEAFGKLLIFKPLLIRILSFKEYSFETDYTYPFVQNYEGYFLCFNEKIERGTKEIKSLKSKADKLFRMNINCSNFQKGIKTTQMKCYGDSIQTRFCETKNLIHYNGMLLFNSQIDYSFPEPFMSISSWPIPNDIESKRLENQPIVVDANPLGSNPQIIRGISYYFARAFNIGMLWHTLFETIAPFYRTIIAVEGNISSKDRHIFYNDGFVRDVYATFYKVFTNYELTHLGETPMNIMFDTCVIGLTKFHPRSIILREKATTFDFEYDPKDLEMPLFRDLVLKYLDASTELPDTKHPHVIVPLRRSQARSIINFNETIDTIEKICTFCEFTYINLDSFSIEDQIRLISGATVVLGVHGSALSHELWLHPSTKSFKSYLLEILPPNYWCRPWYKNVADSINVNYYSVYGDKVDERDSLNKCISRRESCQLPQCHDMIRDQRIYLPNDRIGKVWENIVKELKKAAE